MINSRFLDGMTPQQAFDEVATRLSGVVHRQPAAGRAQGAVPPARLADLAPALLGLPDPGHPLRRLRRGAGAGTATCRWNCPTTSPSTSRAIRSTIIRPGSMSPARNAASRRDATPTRWTRSSIRPGISRASPTRGTRQAPTTLSGRRRPKRLAAGQPVYRRHRARDPASALFALLRPRHEGHRPSERVEEPFEGLFTQGMVVHETYKGPDGWVKPAEVKVEDFDGTRRASLLSDGTPIEIGSIEKMSKSKKNVVDPDDIIGSYGADTARWFMLSDSPPERDVIWTEAGVEGAHRFVQRLWRLVSEAAPALAGVAPKAASDGEAAGSLQGGAQDGEGGRRGDRQARLQQGGRPHLRTRQRAAVAAGRGGGRQGLGRADGRRAARRSTCWSC